MASTLARIPNEITTDAQSLVISYTGRLANDHALILKDYALSLAGLQEVMRVLTSLVLQSFPETAHRQVGEFITFEIRAERPASFDVVIRLTEGVAANVLFEALKWGAPKLVRWFKDAIKAYVDSKASNPDVDAIVETLERLGTLSGISLEPVDPVAIDATDVFQLALEESSGDEPEYNEEEDDTPAEQNSRQAKRRSLIDRIDRSLKIFAVPIESSCDQITVTSSSIGEVLRFGAEQKRVLSEPLILLPKERHWRRVNVKFVRINRKTGRALMYFADDPAGENNSHYSVIIDRKIVRKPANVYTEAFNNDLPLSVLLRHAPAERGRIRTMWEISVRPQQMAMFE